MSNINNFDLEKDCDDKIIEKSEEMVWDNRSLPTKEINNGNNNTGVYTHDRNTLRTVPYNQFYRHAPSNHHQSNTHFSNSVNGINNNEKPALSYAALIAEAIVTSPDGKLTLRDIYKSISAKYPFYSLNSSGWQNSIRHNLSLNKAFIKFPKSGNGTNSKGSFWGITPEDAKQIIYRSRKTQRYTSIPQHGVNFYQPPVNTYNLYNNNSYPQSYNNNSYPYYQNSNFKQSQQYDNNMYNRSFSKIEVSKDNRKPDMDDNDNKNEFFSEQGANSYFKFD